MPIVRYSNELVRLNQANQFQQTVTAPTVSATNITGTTVTGTTISAPTVSGSVVSANSISISGLPALGSQGASRPEEFTEVGQIVEYIDRIKQALVNMGVMQ